MNPRVLSLAKVPLSGRTQIESLDAGLTSVTGALEVISLIRSRHLVTKLVLGHNGLGDEGCEVLFDFLGSEQGQRYRISEISLNSNGIGDRGLLAIANYLRGNTSLKELFLQNNTFLGDSDVVVAFTEAINKSHLETLSLTTNQRLGDNFISHFFPLLDAPLLYEVQISVIGISSISASYIVEYISSPRCRLHSLRANGNRLGLRGVRSIIRAIHRHNFTLTDLELYANGLSESNASSENTTSEDDYEGATGPGIWQNNNKELTRVLLRNKQLKRATEKEALILLRTARAVLLKPRIKPPADPSSMAVIPLSRAALFSSIGIPLSLDPPAPLTFPFTRLPTELQLHILSFLAPILSSAQRIRIYTYAASLTTLPPLLPRLSQCDCLPDKISLPVGGIGVGMGMMLRKRRGFDGTVGSISPGVAIGERRVAPGHVRKEEECARWLALVQCNAFELEEDAAWNEADDIIKV